MMCNKKILIFLLCFFVFCMPCFAYSVSFSDSDCIDIDDGSYYVRFDNRLIVFSSDYLGSSTVWDGGENYIVAPDGDYGEKVSCYVLYDDGSWHNFGIEDAWISKDCDIFYTNSSMIASRLEELGEINVYLDNELVGPPSMTPPVHIVGGVEDLMTFLVPTIQTIVTVACLILCLMVSVKLLRRLLIFLKS